MALTDILEKYKDKKPMDLKTAIERSYPISAVIDVMADFTKEKLKEQQRNGTSCKN